MKLLLFTPYYPPIHSAGATRMFEFVKRISKSPSVDEINIVIWNPNFGYDDCDIPALPKTKVTSVRLGKLLPKFLFTHQDPNPLYALIWFLIAAKYCKRFSPDLVYVTTPPGTIMSCCLWCNFIHMAYAVDYRDLWVDRNEEIISRMPVGIRSIAGLFHGIFRTVSYKSNDNAEIIVTVHEEMKKRLEKRTRTPILLVSNGIDMEESEIARKLSMTEAILKQVEGKDIIAYVGHLSVPYLAPDTILPIIKNLRDGNPRIELWVFSNAPDEKFQSKVENLNLTSHVRFFCKGHTEMLAILRHAKFGYIPLKSDDPQSAFTYPAKFYDYLSARLPILVVSDAESEIYKFVSKHRNGIALTWNEITGLQESSEEMMKNDDYGKVAERTYQDAGPIFDLNIAHTKFEEAIVKVHDKSR